MTFRKFIDQKYFSMLWNKKQEGKEKYQSISWKWNVHLKSQTLKYLSNLHLWFYKEHHIKEISWKMQDMKNNLKRFQHFIFTTMTKKISQVISSFHFILTSEDQIYWPNCQSNQMETITQKLWHRVPLL